MTVNGHSEQERDFRDFVHRHRDLIWHVCSTFRFSAAWEVEDAFHEVLVALWRDRGQYQGHCSERTWVYRVATHTLISLKRRIANQPTANAQPQAEPSLSPDDADRHQYLRQLIDTLDDMDRQIVMAHLYGFSNIEIGRSTGLSAAAVSVRLTRAKRKLKKRYENGI